MASTAPRSAAELTEDHSVVAELIKEGRLTPRGGRTHPLRHQITRSLGSREAVADLLCTTWQAGDYLLLCSDGLTNMIEDRHIKGLILDAGTDVAAACEALVTRANANGGEDHISVVQAYRD
jgi:serine/threonine protein phosphatase PrpC